MKILNGRCLHTRKAILTAFIISTLVLGMGLRAPAMAQTRIVVLPFYTEEGMDAKQGGYITTHYRRMMRFINDQLTRHDFEVINPFAKDSAELEYNRLMDRTREDSPLAVREMCKKYNVDAAYIVWLNVKAKKTADGYYKASARLDGEGYDSAGRDLGVGVSKTFKVTKRDRDDAIAEVEKEAGDLLGRRLTAWSEQKKSSTVVTESSNQSQAIPAGKDEDKNKGSALAKNIEKYENLITVRVDGATEYELLEAFGKVINTVTGVVEAKRYSTRLVPDNPQACLATWRIRIEDTEPFRLQANVMKMINDILDAGGEITLKGVPYRYTPAEVNLLMGLRPGDASSREIQFVFDRERMRDREMQGRHDPYKAKEKEGFE